MRTTFFSLAFTDVYGVPHPDAVGEVANVNMQGAAASDDAGDVTLHYATLSYQVRYWHSPAARAAGAQAQLLVLPSPPQSAPVAMSLSGEGAALPHDQWFEACRSHFETVVAPTLPKV